MNLWAINLFDENFEQLSINIKSDEEKFEPEPTFENTINEIKDNYLKSITYISMNVSDISFNRPSSYYEHLKANLMPWILL